MPASPKSSPSSIDTRRESSGRALVASSAAASLVVVIAWPNTRRPRLIPQTPGRTAGSQPTRASS